MTSTATAYHAHEAHCDLCGALIGGSTYEVLILAREIHKATQHGYDPTAAGIDAYAYDHGATFSEAFGRTDDGYENPADYA